MSRLFADPGRNVALVTISNVGVEPEDGGKKAAARPVGCES